jgi:hypothetical protein
MRPISSSFTPSGSTRAAECVARRGLLLLLLMAASAMIFPRKHARSNGDPVAEAWRRSTRGRCTGKPNMGQAVGPGRPDAMLAPDFRALDVSYQDTINKPSTNLRKDGLMFVLRGPDKSKSPYHRLYILGPVANQAQGVEERLLESPQPTSSLVVNPTRNT